MCVCVSSYWMSHYWHLHSRLTHHIETFPNSEGLVLYLCFNRMSISCLKSGILSGAPSSRNQRWGGAARSCRFRDLPLSSDTHCCWIILLISEFSLQRSGLGRFENISTTIMLAWDRLILSLERKRWQSFGLIWLFSSLPVLPVALCAIWDGWNRTEPFRLPRCESWNENLWWIRVTLYNHIFDEQLRSTNSMHPHSSSLMAAGESAAHYRAEMGLKNFFASSPQPHLQSSERADKVGKSCHRSLIL